MYWIWANEPTAEDEAMLYGVPQVIEQQDLSFDDGIPVSESIPVIEFIRDADSQGRLTDNLIAPGSLGLLFSSRLRATLQKVGVDNIQYFLARVKNPADASSTDDYMLANLIGRTKCIDRANSNLQMYSRLPDRIQFIDSLVLDESKIRDMLMFRTQEHSQVIVAHQKVKDACESAGITGVTFYTPENFSQ